MGNLRVIPYCLHVLGILYLSRASGTISIETQIYKPGGVDKNK